jgi:hypothetical protein
MSEQATGSVADDAPRVDPAPVDQSAVETPTNESDDIDTEAFDRMDAPDEGEEGAEGDEGEEAGEARQRRDAGDDGLVEIEIDGKTHRVPGDLKDAFMRTKDYQEKREADAEARRQVEAQRTELAETAARQTESLSKFREQHVAVAQTEAALAGIEAELAEYRKYTPAQWEQTKADNPALFAQHADRLDFLRTMRQTTTEALEAAKTDLSKKESDLTESQKGVREAALKSAWGETNAALTKEIEGWSPAKGQELGTYLVKEFGVKPEELPEATDPRIWKMADRLMRAEADVARLKTATTQATATDAALKSQAVTPAVKPAGGAPKPTGVNDKLSPEEWMRRRNAQVAKRGKG